MPDSDSVVLQGATGGGVEHATVQCVREGEVIVVASDGVRPAGIAFGCLFKPRVGDRVLVARQAGELWLLIVLARSGGERRIAVRGKLAISAQNLSLRGRSETRVTSEGALGLAGERVDLRADGVDIDGRRLAAAGRTGHVHLRTARLTTSALDVVGERISQCARRIMRRVEERESLHFGTLIQQVWQSLIVRSRRTSLLARKDAHLHGEHIHMG